MTDIQTPTANIPIARLLELATLAACAPSALILSGFRSPGLESESKSDGSPVTQFDRAAEVWPDYREYAKKTTRKMPIFVLSPVAG